jgi:membrane protease YdiL (CAAX protease family)
MISTTRLQQSNEARSALGLVKQHPVFTFYVLAFAISWGGILLLVGGPGGIPGSADQVDRLFLAVMGVWFAGPSVASLVTTALVDGRAGLRELLGRLLRWRVAARWFAVALLTAPLVDAATSLALSLASPEFLPNIVQTSDKTGLLVMAFAYGLIGGGFLEELGWTGFATPRLRSHHSLLGTGLIVGLLWGAYHFSVIYWTTGPSGALPLAILLAQLFAWMPAYRILMVWVYDHTQSLLVAMLMHTSLSTSMFVLQPMTIVGVPLLTYLLVFAAVLWLLAAVVVRANRPQLARPGLRLVAA